MNKQDREHKSFMGGPFLGLELNMVYSQLVRKCHCFFLKSNNSSFAISVTLGRENYYVTKFMFYFKFQVKTYDILIAMFQL